jgi:hypothetical protein
MAATHESSNGARTATHARAMDENVIVAKVQVNLPEPRRRLRHLMRH